MEFGWITNKVVHSYVFIRARHMGCQQLFIQKPVREVCHCSCVCKPICVRRGVCVRVTVQCDKNSLSTALLRDGSQKTPDSL